jgi:hypothetical protein
LDFQSHLHSCRSLGREGLLRFWQFQALHLHHATVFILAWMPTQLQMETAGVGTRCLYRSSVKKKEGRRKKEKGLGGGGGGIYIPRSATPDHSSALSPNKRDSHETTPLAGSSQIKEKRIKVNACRRCKHCKRWSSAVTVPKPDLEGTMCRHICWKSDTQTVTLFLGYHRRPLLVQSSLLKLCSL